MNLAKAVKLVEVGPRDGLQNEARLVPVDIKIQLVDQLSAAGLPVVEVGSFVAPQWVPQMADSASVYAGIQQRAGVAYPMLVPNLKGLEAALAAGVQEIAIFAAASETFSHKNTNCSIAESLTRFTAVTQRAQQQGVRVRAYVSCVLGCPYEGAVPVHRVAEVAGALFELGCYEVSLGDTIGVGTPLKAQAMIDAVAQRVPVSHLAAHFHDSYGQGLANIFAVLQQGVATIDSSVAGLGGCPYAKGASGNVASEDVLYLLQGLGIETGVDLDRLIAAGQFISAYLGRPNASRVARARAG